MIFIYVKKAAAKCRSFCVLSADATAAAADAVTVSAYSEEDDKSDDDEPYYLVLEEFAKAVHISFLSFHFFFGGLEVFTLQYNSM